MISYGAYIISAMIPASAAFAYTGKSIRNEAAAAEYMNTLYTHGMYSGILGVSMMQACACQKLSTMGRAMKMASLAVPVRKEPSQRRRWRRPWRAACARRTRVRVMKVTSPRRKVGRTYMACEGYRSELFLGTRGLFTTYRNKKGVYGLNST